MRTVAVYPGRFHPFSLGHKGVYDHLSNDPVIDDVYVVTSAKQNDTDSPFTYADKIAMMTKIGVPPGRIIQVKNPYKIDEITKLLELDPAQDRLIYALGSDDAKRFNYTKDSPLQLLTDKTKMQPVGKHAYVKVIPQIPYNILGKKLTHASEIRKMYLDGNNNDRNQIIMDLYGRVDPELKSVFDQRLGVNEPKEGIIYGQERIYAGDNPVSVMRENRLAKLKENISMLQDRIRQLRDGMDYIDEKWSRKYKRSINCARPQGFSQKAHCAGRKKK
jgi:nicotinamide mononucleotide adenylyltransferase